MGRGFESWNLTRGHGRRLYQVATALISAMGLFILTTTVWSPASAAAATHFSVSAPATTTAGTAFSVTVTALDSTNVLDPTYAGTVHFTTTDGQAVLPVDSTLTGGIGTFSVTLKTAGSQTVTATDTLDSSITGDSGPIVVDAAAATHFGLSAPAAATAGTAFTFTVTALDQFNNTATGYGGTVHFSSSDGGAGTTLPADATLTNGTGTFGATLVTAGTQTITATDTVTSSITGTTSVIVVNPAAATHFAVSAPATATAGSAFSLTVTALDQFDNTATGYGGIVHFTSTDGQAVLPADATLTNGVGTFSATLKTAGTQTITATDTVTSSITGTSNTIAVNPAAATHFLVSAPPTATSGVAFVFSVVAMDQFNNTDTGYTGTVHFTSSDGAATLPADSTLTNGNGSFSAALVAAGPQTITATDTVNSSITGTSNTIAVTGDADIALTKAVSNATPNVGDTITFTITASNTGPVTATNVTVTDNLPAGLIFVSATPSQGSYNSTTGLWTLGTLPSGPLATLQIQATVVSPNTMANTAVVSHSDQFDPNPANNAATATVTPQHADLALAKTVSDSTPNVGDTVTFTVTATDLGPDAATNVTVTDVLPAGLTFVSATPSQGSYNPTTGVWTVGTVTTGTPQTLQIQATVVSPNSMTNTATVSHSDQFDPNPANNSASATVTPQQADLALTKTVNNATPNVGDTVTFTVTLSNAGPDAATNVTVGDLLPAGVTFVSATPSQGTYNSTTGVWTVGTVTTGTPQTLQIQATVNSASPVTNTATVTHSDQFDPNPANNSASLTLNAVVTATTTTLTASPNPGVSGQAVTLTATVLPVPPGSGHPLGTVEFFDGTTSLGTAALHSPAVFTTSALGEGTHQLTATYEGSAAFSPSTSAVLVVTIAAAPTTTVPTTTTVAPTTTSTTTPTTPTTPPSSGTLPHTGTNSDRTGAFAMLALLIGAALTTFARRRRTTA
jgi:uncharacterized repeat protein (TIGR01451 family)/LPXTG-motif cell wall-anchored protein